MKTSTFIIIFESLASLGLLAGGVGYLMSQFRSGSKRQNNEIVNSSTEIINFYKTENESLKAIMLEKDKSNDAKFQQLTSEIGEIRGQLIEKEKQNKQYLDILQNRDPDTQQFQELLIKSCNDQGDINKQVVAILQEIHKFAIAEHERDFTITSTVTKE